MTLNQATVHGTQGSDPRADVADAIGLDAEVVRLARTWPREGDQSALDVRRSQALGLLANPAAALRLIAQTEPEALADDLVSFLKATRPPRLRPRVELVIHVTQSPISTKRRPRRGPARERRSDHPGPRTGDPRPRIRHDPPRGRPGPPTPHRCLRVHRQFARERPAAHPGRLLPLCGLDESGGCRSTTPAPTTSTARQARPGPATVDP